MDSERYRHDLEAIARRAMEERGLEPDFSADALEEAERLSPAGVDGDRSVQDLRELPWCSIDNDDSRDLDQLTVAEALDRGRTRIRVAVADVDALVEEGSAIDQRARVNTTSVYTVAKVFHMLPERLSTGLTSLNQGEDRRALVIDLVVLEDGSTADEDVYPAFVHNHAKLTYNGVAAWLEGGPMPPRMEAVPALAEQIRIQDAAAQRLRRRRFERGALDLRRNEAQPVLRGGKLEGFRADESDRAKQLIEDFMIAANSALARYLETRRLPSLRRVVRVPRRWDRIVELARGVGERLPDEPDSGALSAFLGRRREADPEGYSELSLAVVKLIGAGEYIADLPDDPAPGHFGLAVEDYTHATAPNRRYPDLITHRILKAALAKRRLPYSDDELRQLARHCNGQESNAEKVERLVRKSAAALLLEDRLGERFRAVVTGASEKGTWVRIFNPPVEGRLERGFEGLDVGDCLTVKLIDVNVERGFIDFARERHG